jgi:hypothetical protein
VTCTNKEHAMTSWRNVGVVGLLAAGLALAGFSQSGRTQAPKAADGPDDRAFTDAFRVEPGELATTGRNPYFILEPGYRAMLRKGGEEVTKTVLNETKVVDGVETRVVEERETKNGQVAEVSRNFFAISRRTNSVYYFGEEVDFYENGKVVNHEGAWLSGVNGARFGLMMPGTVLIGGRHYQEIAPKHAMDRAEILSMTETVTTPAGTFKNCLKVEETSPLEPGVKELKYYAPGVGLVHDGKQELLKYGFADGTKK